MSAAPAAAARAAIDPAAALRAAGLLAGLVVLWQLARLAQVDPSALLDDGNLATMGTFLAQFFPPALDAPFLRLVAVATLETLAMATAGVALAMLIAVPAGMALSETLSVSRLGPGPGRRRAAAGRSLLRAVVLALRGVPEIVWALLFVRALGLGPGAGILALALTYGGMLAKVYAEILDSSDPRPARALLLSGGSRAGALVFGLLPSVARELASYTVYRWECGVRASVVMGFVGAGGLGQLMDQAMRMLNGGEVSTILAVFLLLVLLADAISALLRRLLAGGTDASGPLCLRCLALPLAATAAAVASIAWLDTGMAALWSAESLASMRDYLSRFLQPALGAAYLSAIAQAALETLAISLVGTLLAAALGALLAAARLSGGHLGPLWRWGIGGVLNLLRSVPELVWAALMVLAVGLGPFAGVLALALHTGGVLGRLFAESVENAPTAARDALRLCGASRPFAFLYGTLPALSAQLLAYLLYRWEMNIRMATVLGFVGAGGLGQMLYFELSLLREPQASTVIFAMLLLALAVDRIGARLRRLNMPHLA
ncbi:MAG: ABC transporter permease subunit [Burkholderiaceae bacterium]|nr:ABC transporter permease subunit [Burkholderiaceae bacterium]